MATNDVATLGIQVTTTGAAEGKRSLDELAASGDRAAASTTRLGQANADAAKKYASPQYRQQADDLAKLVGQIDPTVAALGKLDAQQAKLAAFKKSGMLGADDFNALNAAIEANRVKVTAAGAAMHEFSLNNSFARREMGRLAADLANGNFGRFEQTSLTLANASGLIGMAFTGAGLAITGATAAIALFAVGAAKGWAETEKLRVSLIATGDAAGASAAGLNGMAIEAGRVTGKWGDARKAVEEFTASGKVAGAGMGGLAASAVNAADVTGLSIDKVVKQFEQLQDKPAKSVAALNEQYHFLSAAQYAQIQALEEEGRTRDAARLAESAYTSAMADRAKEVQDNAGWIIRSAHAVRDAWNEAWGSIKSLGAQDGLGAQVAAVEAQIKALTTPRLDRAGNLVQAGGGDQLAKLQAQLADLRKQQFDAGLKDVNSSLEAQANGAAIAAQSRLAEFQKPKDALDNTLKKANADRLAALYGVVDPTQRAKIEAEYAQQVKRARDAYDSATKQRGSQSDPFASLSGLVQKAAVFDNGVDAPKDQAEQVTKILAIVDAGAKLIASGRDVARVQAMVADGVSHLNEGYAKEAAQLNEHNVTALQAYKDAISEQISDRQQAIELQVQSIGMGAKEYQQLKEEIDIRTRVSKTIEQLNRQRAQSGANVELIDGQIAAQKASIAVLVAQSRSGYKAIESAQEDWKLGAIRAMTDVSDKGADVAGMTANVFTNAFDGMNNALTNFVMTGKLNFADLTKSILADLAKMELRILESKALQGLLSAFLGSSGGNGEMATSFDSNGTFFSVNANGGVYNSPSLSSYSGQVVDKPTLFAFASGAGLMGEAGPEAIMPLRRGPDGKLGVSGGGGGLVFNQSINIDNSGGTTKQTSSGDSSAAAKQFADRMKEVSRQTIAQEQRPGGLLWRMQHA